MAENLHVVMMPWSAFGHMIPFLQLSIAMAKHGVKVSLLSTPRNIQRLPKPPSSLSSLINLVELPFPKLDHENKFLLPENAEATIDIPFEKMDDLKIAYDLLKQPFEQFVVDHKPDWIFLDFNPDWAVDVAQEQGIPVCWFSVFCAAVDVWLGPPEYLSGKGQEKFRPSPESLMSPSEWIDFPSSVACLSFEAAVNYTVLYEKNGTGRKDVDRIAKIIDTSRAVIIRTCEEFEGEYINLYRKLLGKPVIPAGLLLPEKPEKGKTRDGLWSECFNWLDQQKAKSVIFVGFGSECKLSKDQVYELAHGLELSNLSFIWALRKPDWSIDETAALPPGFRSRTSEKGMVCFGWVPQIEILGHPSIGGSLFHSGWGSIIETLQFGHVLVVLPFVADQGLNARLLVDKGLALEVDRGVDGSFNRNDIAKSLNFAMVSVVEGEELRNRTREAAAIFGDRKLQENYIGTLVKYLKKVV